MEKNLVQRKNDIEYSRLLEAILDQVSEAVYCSDEDGVVLFVNKEAEITDGMNKSDIIGRKEEEIWGTHNHESVFQNREAIVDEKASYTTKNGEIKFVHHSVYPFKLKGKIRGTFSLSKDITKEDHYISQVYRLQQELKVREKKTRKNGTSYDLDSIVGQSVPLLYALQAAKRGAQFQTNIMICGETGTGKELFAQGIHNAGSFRDEPFIGINCSAIPENLLESTLFGSVKGAFTGAENSIGLFQQAKQGTLFLDEIDSMSLAMQAKLLRALQERKVRPVGSHKENQIHCRIISATNVNLDEALKENKIRRDIYYRLSSIIIELPPLRERKGDGPLLMHHFLEQCRRLYGSNLREIDPAVHEIFEKYAWPGNIREMEHMIEGMVILAGENETVLTTRHLPAHLRQGTYEPKETTVKPIDLNKIIDDYERSLIITALNGNKQNLSATARSLNIHRNVLYSKMKRLNIDNYSDKPLKQD